MAYKPKPNETSIRLEGLAQTIKALKEVGVPVQAITQANKEAALPVLRTAMNLAPVQTGALRNSIRIATAATSVKIRAGGKRLPYGNPVHWGWFRDKKTGVNRNILPNPFMSKALGYNREEILATYISNMKKLIAKHEVSSTIKNRS